MTTEIKKLSNGNTQIIARKNEKEVILTINEDLKVVHLDATEGWEKKAPQVEAEELLKRIDEIERLAEGDHDSINALLMLLKKSNDIPARTTTDDSIINLVLQNSSV